VVVPLPPSKSLTKLETLICDDLTVICTHCVNQPILLNKTYDASNGTYLIIIILKNDLTTNFVYRCGCSSGVKYEAGRGSCSALRSPYTAQETYLTEHKIIFRYIIIDILFHFLLQLRLLFLLHTGATEEGLLQPDLNLHCATVRIHFAVVNSHRRG
jgi:hypothetical protein